MATQSAQHEDRHPNPGYTEKGREDAADARGGGLLPPRMLPALAILGFASGLPLLLISRTLQVWMREAGVDLNTISLFGLVALPYSLKVLWAPLLDRFTPPGLGGLGRRRGWLLVSQLTTIALIILLAIYGMSAGGVPMVLVSAIALALTFASASQDIVADAYRSDIVPARSVGLGASVFVSGYRLAMIVAGSVALILSDHMSWRSVYLVMAGIMAIGAFGTLLAPRPRGVSEPASLAEAVIEPFREFFTRNARAALILLFVVLFRLPDTLAGPMTTMLLKDLKYSNTVIGLWQQGFGLGIGIPGAILGGILVWKLGLRLSLWTFGILQAVSNLGFTLLAWHGRSTPVTLGSLTFDPLMVGVIAVENICGGLVAAGFMAYLMRQCNQRYSAAQYALFTSLMAVSGSLIGAKSGAMVDWMGFPRFFAVTVIAAVPGMALLPWVTGERKRQGGSADT